MLQADSASALAEEMLSKAGSITAAVEAESRARHMQAGLKAEEEAAANRLQASFRLTFSMLAKQWLFTAHGGICRIQSTPGCIPVVHDL